jgi:hypothetical protein
MKKVTARLLDADRSEFARLEDLPNVGPAVAADLRRLGVTRPHDLLGRDPYAMYEELSRVTRQRHDPCLLDVFLSAVRFMGGAPAKPWWAYTAERKRTLKARRSESDTE